MKATCKRCGASIPPIAPIYRVQDGHGYPKDILRSGDRVCSGCKRNADDAGCAPWILMVVR